MAAGPVAAAFAERLAVAEAAVRLAVVAAPFAVGSAVVAAVLADADFLVDETLDSAGGTSRNRRRRNHRRHR